ncbi:hypothetical protein L9G74_04190 [Shewanella sp. C32]|uniref:DUF1311 domain-containing protein n=1 Tax=Shewanella electrica TaxID=515560 RepID=A0ABT2FH79_9GAMM|nr:hypothetical protein [Shewanella electrica]MCH1923529.1 hypothetical protein [Shewanella electrica]MCS4555626.1 hypothetical protein [Shewanella electrica]
MKSLLFSLLLAATYGVCCQQAAAQTPAQCELAGLKLVRHQANQLFKQQDYATALEQLTEFQKRCSREMYDLLGQPEHTSDYYWLQSDIMAAQLKTQAYSQCISSGTQMLFGWMSKLQEMPDTRVHRAISYNLKQCQSQFEQPYAVDKLSQTACPVNGFTGTLISQQADTTICLSPQLNQQYDDMVERDRDPAAQFELLTQQGTEQQRQTITIGSGRLADMDLCGVDKTSAGVVNGRTIVRLQGGTGFCHPGNASFIYDGFFELKQGQLVLLDEVLSPVH